MSDSPRQSWTDPSFRSGRAIWKSRVRCTVGQYGVQVSMEALGNPYANAKAESFFKTLKREEVYLKQYQTFQEAQDNIRAFIEDVYNTKRLHSSLGYLPPTEFEEAYRSVKETSL